MPLWYKNEQLKLLSPFAYEVQIQRFKYFWVVLNFAYFCSVFFIWQLFFKSPVIKPLDKYYMENS